MRIILYEFMCRIQEAKGDGMNNPSIISRRQALLGLSAPLFIPVTGCGGNSLWSEGPAKEVNVKSHWARRAEWKGEEQVRGICQIDDRYLMVIKARDPLGWQFPGGKISRQQHGAPAPDAIDLMRAVTDYIHTQAMVQVTAKLSVLVAYGYAMNETNQKLALVHWFRIFTPSASLPQPHPNLTTTTDAKWVGTDNPNLNQCLQQRVNEFNQASEGNTIVIKRCAT